LRRSRHAPDGLIEPTDAPALSQVVNALNSADVDALDELRYSGVRFDGKQRGFQILPPAVADLVSKPPRSSTTSCLQSLAKGGYPFAELSGTSMMIRAIANVVKHGRCHLIHDLHSVE